MLKFLHIPPVWLVLCICVAWWQAHYLPLGLSLDSSVTQFLSGALIGAGLLLMVAALVAFRRHRTTVIPHQTPQRLITDGIFAYTRNPIYLGDTLLLAGLILRFDSALSLVLVPLFVWWIERQFIVPEENRMRRTFRAEFARYEQKVRRWI
ncbi:MAG: isoprenylcysteine carboxylmethyltransferase family protein [Pseudomonadota bacterium]